MADLIKDMIKASKRNAIRVSEQTRSVRSLLSMANTYTRADERVREVSKNKYTSQKADIENEIRYKIFFKKGECSREDLLRTAIICATSVNKEAQAILMHNISLRLGKISYDEFKFMDSLICRSRDEEVVDKANAFLSENIKGFKEAHDMYYYALYNF